MRLSSSELQKREGSVWAARIALAEGLGGHELYTTLHTQAAYRRRFSHDGILILYKTNSMRHAVLSQLSPDACIYAHI